MQHLINVKSVLLYMLSAINTYLIAICLTCLNCSVVHLHSVQEVAGSFLGLVYSLFTYCHFSAGFYLFFYFLLNFKTSYNTSAMGELAGLPVVASLGIIRFSFIH